MRELLSVQSKLVPDLLETMQKRLNILKGIYLQQPIGRRSLATALQTTERILRAEVDFLKEQGLVYVESVGMYLTDTGMEILSTLEEMMKGIYGFSDLEAQLQRILNIKRIIVVPGNVEESDLDKKEMGRMAAQYLMSAIRSGDTVAVTGGTSLAVMAEMLGGSYHFPDVNFVPARGGLGENVELQANQIAATCAQKIGAQYRMLHVSDNVGNQVFHTLMEDPYMREILEQIRSSDIVVHGIGRGLEMAVRRKAPAELIKKIETKKAVGEAFGYYFDKDGHIVHRMETIGLRLEDVQSARLVIGIAGGQKKSEAIYALAKAGFIQVLILDQSAAEGIIRISNSSY